MKGIDMKMSREQMLFEAIIRRLDSIERKIDAVNDKVDGINERLDDAEYQRYAGGVR
jgi:hypothetical protein